MNHSRTARRSLATTLVALLFALWGATAIAQETSEAPRRLRVLFFGAPTENGPHHDPITRYRTLKKAFGTEGIDLTYVEDPKVAFDGTTLGAYDALLMYGNWEQHGRMPIPQLKALLAYVE
ncbi:MAG: hypothetical protein RL398_2038, partial [Planctomycetota bacterium]